MKSGRCVLSVMLVAPVLQAQLVNDGATNTLSNTTNTITGGVTVGTNGSFTLLVVSNNALLTNSTFGSIGGNATAKTNEVRLLAPTARWRMGGNLFAGSNGAFSRLVVSNGALVEDFDGVLANGAASSNNSALVTGSGSVWSNRGDLTVGFSGKENQLLITNGGRVVNRFSYLGRQPGSSNNLARITGAGSVWSNLFDLSVGANDRSNRLIIEAAGTVSCANGFISGSSSAGNCEALVTGHGSLWSNRFFLFIGDVAASNQLVVSNGARVVAGGSILGNLSPAMSNQVLVTGLGSLWTNESSLSLGGSSGGNRADATAGGWLACVEGLVGENASSHSNTVVLSDSGSGWNVLERLTLGKNGSTNVLIANNGATILSSNATIGANVAFGSNNLALLTGTGTVWSNRNEFLVGSNGSNNRLVVSNAAHVFVGTNVFVGFNAFSSNNSVLVTGTGSMLSSVNNVIVGQVGSGNRLMLSNGASINSQSLYLGINSLSSSNEATITGPGTVWTAPEWGVGSGGRGNRLLVNNGGQVRGTFASVGAFGLGGDNLATLTDPGSSWTNSGDFFVGLGDSRNSLVVSNGGVLFTESMTISRDPSSLSNRITVAGGTMLVANDTATGTLEVRRGTNVLNSGLIDVDQLLMTNSVGRFEFNGGTLISRGAFVTNGVTFIVGNSGVTPAVWDVRAGISNHFLVENLLVGNNSPSNQLLVLNGAVLLDNEGALGFNTSSSNNLALVANPGSLWTNRDDFYIGYAGSGNQLVVSNGGTVFAQGTRFVSHFSGAASNNAVTVTGPNSRWLGPGDVEIGGPGAFCRLLVSHGGRVENNSGFVGDGTTASNNLAVVTDFGSVWTNMSHLHVGSSGSGNQLIISNGASVFTLGEKRIGHFVGASSNSVLVTGVSSAWLGNGNLYVGSNGFAGRLLVTDGAALASSYAELGGSMGADYNEVIVSGAGSTWTNLSTLNVGQMGSVNHLFVTNGGFVASSNGIIGALSGATVNAGIVDGGGSRWLMPGELYTGSNGGFSVLIVTNGGFVANSNGFIGFNASSGGNVAIVTGGGTVWSNANDVLVGRSGSVNQLIISNGAVVLSRNGELGSTTSSSNNVAVVSGPGSVWSNLNLSVGLAGSSNRLIVSNGGRINSNQGFIGSNVSSRSNEVTITGLGSLWTITNSLFVGFSGSSNRLVVSNGGAVVSAFGSLGSRSNEVLIAGPGSSWKVLGSLEIGSTTFGNRLVVSNAGVLQSGFAAFGSQPSAGGSSNEVIVTGAGTLWTNLGDLYVGQYGSANRLVLTNGALCVSTRFSIGQETSSSNNRVVVDGGSLSVTNGSTARLDIKRGTNVFNSGLIDARQLLLTNSLGRFEFNGGTLITRGALVSNGVSFVVGRTGVNPAIWDVRAGATNTFLDENLTIGLNASFNQLILTNGALLTNSSFVTLGQNVGANSNNALIAGPGSQCLLGDGFIVGDSGSGNRLILSNGAALITASFSYLGFEFASSNNEAVVTGPGTSWTTVPDQSLFVGYRGRSSRLLVNDGGLVSSSTCIIGDSFPGSSNNLIQVSGGTLRLQNLAGTGELDIRGGTNRFDAGVMEIDRLTITNTRGVFEFNGGQLFCGNSLVNNGQLFRVGNGINAATLTLAGNGVHLFANGITVSSNATLTGNGTVGGPLTLSSGSQFSPGLSVGKIVLSHSPVLQGATVMEISKNGAALTNDQIQVAAPLTFGGALIVTNLGPSPLAAGDRFPLFSATGFAGAFSSIILPPIAPTLVWTNKLALDGSLEVAPLVVQPVSLTIQRSNNLLLISWPTNAADFCLETTFDLKPPVAWQTVGSGITTNGGSFLFSLPLTPVAKQFFRLAFPCAAAPVALSIQLSNKLVTVSWPSNAFRLETAFNLAPPVSWQTISTGISNIGESRTFTFTNNPSVINQFFRQANP